MAQVADRAYDFASANALMIAGITTAGVSLLALRRYLSGGKLRATTRIDGKVAIVTGANTGIGLQTAKVLLQRGARVVLACRSESRGKAAERLLRDACGAAAPCSIQQLDLASLQSVRDFARRFLAENQRLDLLINNAGVMLCPESYTQDGFEMQFGVNHLGHFLLTNLLLPLLRTTPQARIVNVSSLAHTGGKMNWDNLNLKGEYSPMGAYCQSKLANVLFTNHLAKRLQGDDVTAYSLHPGVVRTELGRHLPKLVMLLCTPLSLVCKSPMQGAQTSLHCALAPLQELTNAGYYSDCQLKDKAKQATSEEDAERLWRLSEKMVGLRSSDAEGDN